MEKVKNGERIGVYLNDDLLNRCDLAMNLVNVRSRSEFIRDALEHYIATLNVQGSSRVLTPALESVINSRIAMTEDRLSQLLFKLGVEIAMMNKRRGHQNRLRHARPLLRRVYPGYLCPCDYGSPKRSGNNTRKYTWVKKRNGPPYGGPFSDRESCYCTFPGIQCFRLLCIAFSSLSRSLRCLPSFV